ncbi:hypothetical protein SDC9_210663 [bioreactor metagenome]|uniref:Uncharacterized protein n=1 Tax=bioreactor metagenome TaxID=1076179 RepID=A0A645JIG7_9ZZZZ
MPPGAESCPLPSQGLRGAKVVALHESCAQIAGPVSHHLRFDVLSHNSRSDGVGKPDDLCHRLDGLLLEALAQQCAVDLDYVRPHPAYKPRRRKDVLWLAVIQSDPHAQRGALPGEVEKSADVVDRIRLGHFDDHA